MEEAAGTTAAVAMRILMITNTYRPITSGVTRSVCEFSSQYLAIGHDVLIIAPQHPDADEDDHVLRVPAVNEVFGSQFALPLPIPGYITRRLDQFQPEIVHAHQPFLLGAAALRISALRGLPIVYTRHTRYEAYGHHIGLPKKLARLLVEVTDEYGCLCDGVIAPSSGIAATLPSCTSRQAVIPTGINTKQYTAGDGNRFREQYDIPTGVPLIGYVGRLSAEKNLHYLLQSIRQCLRSQPDLHAVLIGDGELRKLLVNSLEADGLQARVRFPGIVSPDDLPDAYQAMDLFVFASQSETQGIVLAESLASGTPIVALSGTGTDDCVQDGVNGRLLPADTPASGFAEAVQHSLRNSAQLQQWSDNARQTATMFDRQTTADAAIRFYAEVLEATPKITSPDSFLEKLGSLAQSEWDYLSKTASGLHHALTEQHN